ncbi:MAG: hypothetical protein M3O34_06030 [Chloroflexota bacterium]|nr:hypothetical protein [Chloroflexota bacterium]
MARRFHAFLRERGHRLGRPAPGDPNRREPDALCTGPTGVVGIEVTCPYYDRAHAAATWASPERHRPAGRPSAGLPASTSSAAGPDAALLDEMLVLLDRKLRKAYRVPTYLVLDASHADLTSSHEAGLFVPALEYRAPSGSPIVGVYLALSRPFTGATDFFEVPRA